jgi:monoamine oxidase
MLDVQTEVLIIGAGAAGLAPASELAGSGRRVLVLEARDRIGGRIWTQQQPDLTAPLEYGAEFIHGHAAATMAILRKGGKAVVESADTHFRLRGGEIATRDDYFREVQRVMCANRDLKDKDLSFDAFLEQAHGLSAEARQFAKMMAEGFDAADTQRASARAIVAEWTADMMNDDAPQARPQHGYDALLATLAGSLRGGKVDLRLQSVVRSLLWSKGSVEAEGSFIGAAFRARARCAIVTLPLGVLQQPPDAPYGVRFNPEISAKRAALQGLTSGPVVKLMLRFASAFWEELKDGQFRNAAFFHAPEADFPTFWTQLPLRAPLLVAWAGGPKAARLACATPEEVVARAVRTLAAMFGPGCQPHMALEGSYYHDWQRDPFARGAYSYVTVGASQARALLAAPLEETLFFAGEATDTEGESATVTGAVQSGIRAAREVLAR